MAQISLHKYLKPASKPVSVLPSPEGPLSHDVPSSSIAAANKRVAEVIDSKVTGTKKLRGSYEKYSPVEKATVGNYTVLHGTSAAMRHFKSKHPGLK